MVVVMNWSVVIVSLSMVVSGHGEPDAHEDAGAGGLDAGKEAA